MSAEGGSLFDAIVNRIKAAEGVTRDKDVATVLQMDARDVAARKARGGPVPYKQILEYSRAKQVSLEFLLNGRGPVRTMDMAAEPGAIYRVGTDVDVVYRIAAEVYRALQELGARISPEKFEQSVRLVHRMMLDRGETEVSYPQVLELVRLAL